MENPANSTERGPAEREDVKLHKTHLDSTREMYCQVTDNKWIEADWKSYRQNRIADIPIDKVISAVEAVSHRAAVTINSFSYFVKEILTFRRTKSGFSEETIGASCAEGQREPCRERSLFFNRLSRRRSSRPVRMKVSGSMMSLGSSSTNAWLTGSVAETHRGNPPGIRLKRTELRKCT